MLSARFQVINCWIPSVSGPKIYVYANWPRRKTSKRHSLLSPEFRTDLPFRFHHLDILRVFHARFQVLCFNSWLMRSKKVCVSIPTHIKVWLKMSLCFHIFKSQRWHTQTSPVVSYMCTCLVCFLEVFKWFPWIRTVSGPKSYVYANELTRN